MGDRRIRAIGSSIGDEHACIVMACVTGCVCRDHVLAQLVMFCYRWSTELDGSDMAVSTVLCLIVCELVRIVHVEHRGIGVTVCT